MPNRTLKESICTSKRFNGLTIEAQMLYLRLVVNCDDYGRCIGEPEVVRSRCYPYGNLSQQQVNSALADLARTEMVQLYEVGGMAYLAICAWREHNTPRASKSKYPEPPAVACRNLQTSACKCAQIHADSLEHEHEHEVVHEVEGVHANACNTAPDGAAHIEDSGEDDALPEMTPLEDELRQLPAWGRWTMDDRAWLETFSRDYPDTIPRDVRDMGVYWVARAEKDKKVKHSKTQWKQRLRTWSRIKAESGGGNGRHEKSSGSARALPTEYEQPPIYTRPLLKD